MKCHLAAKCHLADRAPKQSDMVHPRVTAGGGTAFLGRPSTAVNTCGTSKLRFVVKLKQFDVFVPDLVSMILKAKEPFSREIFHGSGLTFKLVLVFLAIGADTRLVKVIAIHCRDLFTID